MIDRTVRALSFGSQAEVYEAVRPRYPRQAVEWILEPVAGSDPLRIADIGAGTGKLTRVLREVSDDVVAVDPDRAMLGRLKDAVPDATALEGRGEAIPLPDSSRDAVVFGQSWHWTDDALASREVGRVLRDGGVLGLLWNIRDTSTPWVHHYAGILRGSDSEKMIENEGVRIEAPFAEVDQTAIAWSVPMTREALLNLARSRSHFITADERERARIIAEIEALSSSLGLDGDATIDLPYNTHCFRAIRPARS